MKKSNKVTALFCGENEFKDIPNYEGRYAVTQHGRVWSYRKETPVGKNGGVRVDGDRWLKLHEAKAQSGKIYHRVVLIDSNGKRKQWLVHRLVSICFIPNPDNLPFINHKSGVTTDNRVENLEWCTPQQNAAHAYMNGWVTPPNQSGTNNSNASITVEDVRQIRALAAVGMGDTAISRKLNLTRNIVKGVTKGKNWKEAA